jgi:ABC-2 type transport system ATP-binding protein
MSEMALTAEHLIVIGRGELIADMGVEELVRGASKRSVLVRSPQVSELVGLIAGAEVTSESMGPSTIEVRGLAAEQIGRLASEHGIVLHELTPREASLEEAFMELTGDALEFHADASPPALEPEGALA